MGLGARAKGLTGRDARVGGPLKVVAIYAAIASLWILCSDGVVGLMTDDPALMRVIGLVKGWAFVAVTAAILYRLIHRMLRIHTAAHGDAEKLLREVQTVARLGYYVFDVIADRWISSDILDTVFGIGPDYPRDAAGWLALVEPEMRGEMADYLATVMASDGGFNYEYAIHRADNGERRWVAGLGRVDRDGTGKPLRMVGTIQDITDRVTAENAMREQAELLALSNADLERFAYVASHDLRTPLRNIVSYAQLLERRYKGRFDADADEFITFIVDNGKRMTHLITDLLDYSRVTSLWKPLDPVSANDAVAQALDTLKPTLDAIGAEVTIGPLPLVIAEQSHLISLFQNLLGNAIKYRSDGRKLVIAVTAERIAPDRWRFAVADNGIGIEPQYFDKIFEIFQRLHPASERDGTGIGLTLCRRIVHRFGGTIWVDSKPGLGTTFFFALYDGFSPP